MLIKHALVFVVLFGLFGLSTSTFATQPNQGHSVEVFVKGATPTSRGHGDPISDDAIFSDVPAKDTSLPPWAKALTVGVAEVVKTFFSGLVADPNGAERPLARENPIDQFVKRIEDTNFQMLLQGVGNLKYLGGPYYYNELQGGIGVEYDFVRPNDSEQSTIIAVRLSPLYGELAVIRVDAGARYIDNLPTRGFMGSSAGIEISKQFGPVEPGLRAYARPEWSLDSHHDFGVSIESALYARFRIAKLYKDASNGKPALYLTPTLAFYDRGNAKKELYEWDARQNGAVRTVADLRKFWEATLMLEVRY